MKNVISSPRKGTIDGREGGGEEGKEKEMGDTLEVGGGEGKGGGGEKRRRASTISACASAPHLLVGREEEEKEREGRESVDVAPLVNLSLSGGGGEEEEERRWISEGKDK